MSDRLTTSTGPLPRLDANLGYRFRLAHQRFRALLTTGPKKAAAEQKEKL